MDNVDGFNYTYSAAQRQEIEHIRKKYLPKEEDKMSQLRKLHYSASRKAQRWAIILGVIGALVLGTGMSLIMTDLSGILSLEPQIAMTVGIFIGVVGLVLVTMAYPVYNRVLKTERQRIAPQILQLSEDLLK